MAEMILEYVLGFAFGWTIFQALFMRDMAGGTYLGALKGTFMSELLSMNLLMAGHDADHDDPQAVRPRPRTIPLDAEFLVRDVDEPALVGFILAYPMNWWLVANHLKHGMMTVRPETAPEQATMSGMAHAAPAMSHISMPMAASHAPRPSIAVMALLSFVALAAGWAIAVLR